MENVALSFIRIFFGFFFLATLLGWLWYAQYFDYLETLYTFMLSVALFTAAITPYKKYSQNNNVTLSAIYMLGISSIAFIVYGYFETKYEVNYFGVVAHIVIAMLMLIPLRLSLGKR